MPNPPPSQKAGIATPQSGAMRKVAAHPSPAAVTAAMPPEISSRFLAKREIGRGGMCVVYEADHRYTRRPVALKVLLPDVMKRDEMRARLLREASALGTIRHDNVIQILDAGVTSTGDPFLVLELMNGRTLEGIIAARGSLSGAETAHLGIKICAGLEAAHRRGIVHRDIKPGNIFVIKGEGSDLVKVADFGLACLPSEEARGVPKLTGHGVVLGTAEYMSPEQILARPVSPRSDIWAVGVLLHECLTGTVPFVGNFHEVLAQAQASQGSPFRISPDAPVQFAGIINRALSFEAEDRFQTISELARALEATGLGKTPLNLLSGVPGGRKNSVVDNAQRAHERAPFVTPVRVDANGVTIEGWCENISAGGLLVFVNTEMTLGTPVKLAFSLPGSGRVAHCTATVRWTKKCPNSPRYLYSVGVEFFGLDVAIEAEIQNYVHVMLEIG